MSHNTILVTGARGFVGSALVSYLKKRSDRVIGIDSSDFSIVNRSKLATLVSDKKVTHIVHLAGKSLVESGQDKPYETFKTNVHGTLNVLDVGREHNLKKIIIASTSHVYGKNRTPYYEGYPPRPSRPYETSKTCADLIAQSYADSFSLPVIIPRFVNIYGPGDTNYTRLIPKTIRAVLQKKSPTMWGSGNVQRDYLYIDDAVRAYSKLLTSPMDKIVGNNIINIGTGHVYSVKDIMQTILNLCQSEQKIKISKDQRVGEIASQYVSIQKARRVLNWKPRVSLEEGLKKSIAWYTSYV